MEQSEKANELETLLPERQVEIDGEPITVREYGFLEGLRVNSLAAELIEALSGLFLNGAEPREDGEVSLNELSAVFGCYPAVMVSLLAMACDKPEQWVEDLDDRDGQLLLMTWWAVNRDFFVRRLLQEMVGRQALEQEDRSAGASASPA